MHKTVKYRDCGDELHSRKLQDYFLKLRCIIIFTIIFVNSVVLAVLLAFINFNFKQSNSNSNGYFLQSLMNNDGEYQQTADKLLQPMTPGNHDEHAPADDFNHRESGDGMPPPPHDPGAPEPLPDYNQSLEKSFFLFPFLSLIHQKMYEVKKIYDFFTVEISSDGRLIRIIANRHSDIDTESFALLIKDSYNKISTGYFSGSDDCYVWDAKKNDGNYIVAFVNDSYEKSLESSLFYVSLGIFIVCLFFSIIIAIPLAVAIVKPIRKTFEMQKRFISDAGHELKTPIAVIGANVEVLESEIPGNKWLEYIKSENEHIGKLVTDLLELARNDTDREKYFMKIFNLSDLVESTVLPFEMLVYDQGKKLETDIGPDINMYADPDKMKQVLIILIDNALKYSDEGALIKISLKAHGINGLNRRLVVYNTGRGIAPENLKKVFQRFFRVDVSRNKKTGGSGLGLSIAESIVNAFHGTITVESEYGKWVEFQVSLPFPFSWNKH